MGRKRLPSSLFTTPSKSPPKDSLISSDGSEMLLLIVMLVEICTNNMSHEYQAHLENLDIIQFAQLLQKARKTAISIKPSTAEKSKIEKKSAP